VSLLSSIGARKVIERPPVPVASPSEWLLAAENRLEWMLWGKAMPSSMCPAHPLLCHMLDVAAVAAMMLTERAPVSTRTRLLRVFGDDQIGLRSLLLIIALHDLGKATPAFQGKVPWAREELGRKGFDFRADKNARHHGEIGLVYLRTTLNALGLCEPLESELARAVAAHHGEYPPDLNLEQPGPHEDGNTKHQEARAGVVKAMTGFFEVTSLKLCETLTHADINLLAGLTAVADWIGSMAEVFTYEPPQTSLAAYWPTALHRAERALDVAGLRAPQPRERRSFKELFPRYSPWPLHAAAEAVASRLTAPSLIILEAPMGEGKTEAALLLADAGAANIGQDGFFIGLPTQATANQMFGRVERFLCDTRPQEASSLVLAHGEASLVERFARIKLSAIYDAVPTRHAGVAAESWFLSKKRSLIAPHAVGTIDQALLSVMLVPHGFVRLYGLAGKVVVLDEVHAYDTYTSALLDRLLSWLAACGTTVLLLSATLPSKRRAALVSAYQQGANLDHVPVTNVAYPRITIAGSVETSAQALLPRGAHHEVAIRTYPDHLPQMAQLLVSEARQGRCVGLICNTVARAQEALRHVRAAGEEVPRLLLHARLLPTERQRRELQLETWLGPPHKDSQRPSGCVVVGTQVLEQSLDVDFDVLFSELAPIDLLLQRMGRLWRHERAVRPKGCRRSFGVLCPAGTWDKAPLKKLSGVYDEVPVRRTLQRILERARSDHSYVTLPNDIERLIEEVYADLAPASEDQLVAAWQREMGEAVAEGSLARQRLIPKPTEPDSPFGNLRVFLREDDDPLLHHQLRAATRLGPPSIELVCVVSEAGVLQVGDGDTPTYVPEAEPDWKMTQRLVRRSIGVTSPGVVRAVVEDQAFLPAGFAASALLRHRRLVIFENNVALVGDATLTLDDELGLVINYQKGQA
jgi:CRISPR-associated endonuclease/helicase Cas3